MSYSSSPFVVNSNALFICGTGDGTIAIMDTGTDRLDQASHSSLTWKIVATAIGTLTIPTGTEVYSALEIFGTVIEGEELDELREELFNSQVLVNRDGYQIKHGDAGGFVIGSNYNDMVKMDDLFGWGKYGVMMGVDYVAAEEMEEAEYGKQRRKLRKSVLKEEILGHHKRMLEAAANIKEVMAEMEAGRRDLLRDVFEEKNRANKEVIEANKRVIEANSKVIEANNTANKKVIEANYRANSRVIEANKRATEANNKVIEANNMANIRVRSKEIEANDKVMEATIESSKRINEANTRAHNRVMEANKRMMEADNRVRDASNRVYEANNRVMEANNRAHDRVMKANKRVIEANNRVREANDMANKKLIEANNRMNKRVIEANNKVSEAYRRAKRVIELKNRVIEEKNKRIEASKRVIEEQRIAIISKRRN